MARLQNPESQARYMSYIVMFVYYVLRLVENEEVYLAALSDSDDSDESEDPNDDDDSDKNSKDGQEEERKPDLFEDARELFPWQGRQKDLARELWAGLEESNEKAHVTLLLRLLDSFIFQNTGDNLFSSGLIHYIAVLRIDTKINRLQTAKNYSYMLASMVYCTRVIAIESLLLSAERQQQGDEDRAGFIQKR
ncbi:uncharacterized protein PV09_09492 [Verruconis gallopava]|uniref:Uncharacterized protein n=1 Tax=Verruconis gallopava TaxID=253628 RepID=A0A0D1X9B6_9PEZI|nr:uncharacterized protein PV09_09492 [Verruconis gallopava]KIV98740.1 hypothetical protein PV09_09492 [Verruconis gallopava]